MQVITDKHGFVTDYATLGILTGGIKVDEPKDISFFENNFSSYKVKNGILQFDSDRQKTLDYDVQTESLRMLREKECFSYINRGQLWYENLKVTQLLELRKWYKDWLKVTETRVIPKRPDWLK